MRAVVWEADVIAGADELLPILKRLGVKVGVLASGERAAELDEAPYRAYIDALVISETNSIDPAKRGLVDILERLHVAPEQAVMVSDRVFDIMGGKEGRLAKTVGVGCGNGNPRALAAAGADHIISDIPSLLDVLE